MKNNVIALYLCIILISLLVSCDYTPTGVYIRSIETPSPNIDFIVLDSTDINYLRGTVEVSFLSILNDYTYLRAELYVDSTKYPIYANENCFTINTLDFNDGEHTLKIILYTTTNSGSLADNLKLEAFVIEKEYKSYFFNAPVQAPLITVIKDTMGTLSISWEKYDQLAFRNYIIEKNGSVLAEISNQDQINFFDNTYLGDHANYRIGINVGGVKLFGRYESFYDSIPQFISLELVEDSTKIKLNWERCYFDSAFYSYRIQRKNYFSSEPQVKNIEINDIDQTEYIDEEPVFDYSHYYLSLISKTEDSPIGEAHISPQFIGKLFKYTNDYHLEFIKETNKIYVFYKYEKKYSIEADRGILDRYDGSTFKLLDSHVIYFASETKVNRSDISSDGKWLYIKKNRFFSDILKCNISNFSDPIEIRLSDLHPREWDDLRVINVSDNERLIALSQINHGGIELGLFDMKSKSYLGGCKVFSFAENLQINKDGEYIIHDNNLYKFNIDTLINVGVISNNAKFMDQSDRIIQQVGSSLQILQLPGLNIFREVQIDPDAIFIEYDTKTSYAGCGSKEKGYYYIIDTKTGNTIKRIPISYNGFRFQNGALFSGWSYLDLKLP